MLNIHIHSFAFMSCHHSVFNGSRIDGSAADFFLRDLGGKSTSQPSRQFFLYGFLQRTEIMKRIKGGSQTMNKEE